MSDKKKASRVAPKAKSKAAPKPPPKPAPDAERKAAPKGNGDIEWSDAPYIAASGMCMGSADVVPGVSGGTMAVALGIYARLLAAIASVNMRSVGALLRFRLAEAFSILHWRFIVVLLGGIATALVVMLKIVKLPELLKTQQTHVYAVFFGLVLASAVVLGRRIPWNALRATMLAAGVVVGYVVVSQVPVETPDHPAFIFLSGFIAISAMLLPGISGSFILLILGKYAYVLDAVSELRFGVILPFVLGCATGVLTFARVVGWLLRKWEHATIAFLTGLLLGSLWRIWPWQHIKTIVVREKERIVEAKPFSPDHIELSVLALFALGFLAVVAIEIVASKRHAALAVATAHKSE